MQRHASLGNSRALVRKRQARTPKQVYLGRHGRSIRNVYLSDEHGSRPEGRFRWLISTCLAGAVGMLAIAVVISGSLKREKSDGFLDPFAIELQKSATQPFQFPKRRLGGLKWAVPKSERLQIATGIKSTKQIIHESMRQKDDDREIMLIKPYAKLSSKLAQLSPEESETIPPFNPLKLYSASRKLNTKGNGSTNANKQVAIQIINLNGTNLPIEDNQEFSEARIASQIAQMQKEARGVLIQASFSPTSASYLNTTTSQVKPSFSDRLPPATTELLKNRFEQDVQEDLSSNEVKAIKVKSGDSLEKLLLANGAEPWQANQMAKAATEIFPAKSLSPGQIIYLTLAPSLTQPDKLEPARFSIFARGHRHKVTVSRNDAGDFKSSINPVSLGITEAVLSGTGPAQRTSLYASIFHAMRQQGLSDTVIMKVLRMHAYDTDFRKKVRPGDGITFFFDMRDDDKGADSPLGEMLLTVLTVGEDIKKFYRFRSTDGRVDFYDENGNNSKKFLTRKPIRNAQVRLTSGFGVRFHPIARRRKMHTGVDWGGVPIGTPILAAGNGVIEQAGRKGGYGNYVRIRHANGYQTSYAHMHRIGQSIRPGIKVRQGQVIGSVGNTGFSTGPHLHFEVLVNKRQIDPMKMRVPQERRLRGKNLVSFKRERARIENLMLRAPIARPGQ